MKVIQIKDSYLIWNTAEMRMLIKKKCHEKHKALFPEQLLNRSYRSMYIEWWLHNIGYYLTKPFCSNTIIKKINLRCKDVDLEEWIAK
jgi:hypothetical protein